MKLVICGIEDILLAFSQVTTFPFPLGEHTEVNGKIYINFIGRSM